MGKRIKKSRIKAEKQEILDFFKKSAGSLQDLYTHLSVKDETSQMFTRLLVDDLVDEKKLFRNTETTFSITQKTSEVVGKVDFVNPNFGFIRYDTEQADVYVSKSDMYGALDGDTVRVKITKAKGNNKNPEGEVIEIVSRGRTDIVGKIKVFPNYALVQPDVKGFSDSIFIPKDKALGATTNDLVIVELTTFPNQGIQGSGIVTSVLGQSGDNNAEMHAIMAEFGLPVQFPKDVVAESEAIPEEITAEEIKKRRDMREVLTFTIDPEDAKDFDDAISFQHLESGNYEIGVHIADVSHYVTPGSRLEEEAYRRATSVYLVDRTIPMLPERLSNNLCSLRPNEDKLVFSAIFEMNPNAEVVSQWFGRCIIHSDRRFAYEEAQEVLDGKPDETYEPVLKNLNALAHILRDRRFKSGAFNFETNEVKFHLDETGKPTGIYQKVRKDAHKLIEEFMLLANKQVATFVFSKGPKNEDPYTMVYRVHEPPNPSKVETFAQFAAKMGFTIKTSSVESLSKSLNNLMFEIEGKPIQNVLESLAVRTMSKARYSTENLGHFGLAFDHYSHFTSPIRRYPDVMAHRMLQHYLDGGKSLKTEDFEDKCKHSSDQEKLASEAERASIKYKQVEYMSYQSRNEVFRGVISGVADFGIFVEIENTGSEGMVRLADLNDDYYEYDADNFRVVGRKTGTIIGFGYAVEVKVKNTDIEKRSIELTLISVSGKDIKSKAAPQRRGKPSRKKRYH